MSARGSICQRLANGESVHGNNLGGYHAAVRVEKLPPQIRKEDRNIVHGYAVGYGGWLFYTALVPAYVAARSLRMSEDVHGVGVFRAACEVRFCGIHKQDERALHIAVGEYVPGVYGGGTTMDTERKQEEREEGVMYRYFAKVASENPQYSSWAGINGYPKT